MLRRGDGIACRYNAYVIGSSGLVVAQMSPGGLGDATVVVGANGEIIGDGTDLTDAYNGNGIFAGNQGIGLTSVTTGAGTSVTGAANGIVAFQTDPQSISTMTIVTGGPVRGNGDVPFELKPYTDAFFAAGLPTTGLGIGVSNEGTGDVIVTAGGTVTGSNVGIQTLAVGGGGITVTTDAAVEGTAVAGILAGAIDGNVTVTANDDVTGGSVGIGALAGGTGNIAVTTGGSAEGTAFAGILTQTPTPASRARQSCSTSRWWQAIPRPVPTCSFSIRQIRPPALRTCCSTSCRPAPRPRPPTPAGSASSAASS